jgi:pyrimidine-nucleoside phosphorylase
VIDLRPLIAKKRDGHRLDPAEIDMFVAAASAPSPDEPQLSAMLMAVFLRGLDEAERTAYALSMMRSGEVLDWSDLGVPTVDKHSTGGVGDKVSLPWAPLMAAAGFAVPMISGRGLGHTGGTLDKLEAIPGYRTDLGSSEMRRALREAGCTITGQTQGLVPADRTLYALRSRTATVPTLDHIAPSILSKKLAEGAETLVLDVKVGLGAFMQTEREARRLLDVMLAIARGAGRNADGVLSPMDTPLGRTVGNALEVEESIECLRGGGPADLRALVLDLAVRAALASGRAAALGLPSAAEPLRARFASLLDGGAALERFRAMIEAHAGDGGVVDDTRRLSGGPTQDVVLEAEQHGEIIAIDALQVGLAVADLGGARGPDGSAPHPGVGVVLHVGVGDTIDRLQPWVTLRVSRESSVEPARARMEAALRIDAG